MELKQLHYFLKVCDASSLSDAAHVAGISQPALSRHVRLLEDELGVPLFTRHPRGMVLSPAGQHLREAAALLLKDADRIKADLAAESSHPKGAVAVGTPSSLRRFLVTPALVHMRANYPAVRFRIHESTSRSVRDGLVAGQTDLALLSTLEDLDTLNVIRLASESLFLIGPRRAQLQMDKPVPVSDIAKLPMILTARPNSLRVIVDRALARFDLDIEATIEVETLQMALDLIDTTGSYSVFPYCAIEIALRENRITASPIEKLRISWAIATVKERPQSTAARLFIEQIVDQCRHRAAAGEWHTGVLNLQA